MFEEDELATQCCNCAAQGHSGRVWEVSRPRLFFGCPDPGHAMHAVQDCMESANLEAYTTGGSGGGGSGSKYACFPAPEFTLPFMSSLALPPVLRAQVLRVQAGRPCRTQLPLCAVLQVRRLRASCKGLPVSVRVQPVRVAQPQDARLPGLAVPSLREGAQPGVHCGHVSLCGGSFDFLSVLPRRVATCPHGAPSPLPVCSARCPLRAPVPLLTARALSVYGQARPSAGGRGAVTLRPPTTSSSNGAGSARALVSAVIVVAAAPAALSSKPRLLAVAAAAAAVAEAEAVAVGVVVAVAEEVVGETAVGARLPLRLPDGAVATVVVERREVPAVEGEEAARQTPAAASVVPTAAKVPRRGTLGKTRTRRRSRARRNVGERVPRNQT